MDIISLAILTGLLFIALVSAIAVVRDLKRIDLENRELRRQLFRLRAHLESPEMTLTILQDDPRAAQFRSIPAALNLGKAHAIEAAPAQKLVSFLKWVFPKKTFEHIFSQIVIDGREEYFEALSEGRSRLARWRLAQIYLIVIITTLEWVCVSLVQRAVRLWRLGN